MPPLQRYYARLIAGDGHEVTFSIVQGDEAAPRGNPDAAELKEAGPGFWLVPERMKATLEPEARQTLMQAHDDIVILRRSNAEMAPKAEAYDALIAVITRLEPATRPGEGIDVAWRIKKLLESQPSTRPAGQGTGE